VLQVFLMDSLVPEKMQCLAGESITLCQEFMIRVKLTSDLRIMLTQDIGGNIYIKLKPNGGDCKVITEDITPFQIQPLSVVEIHELSNDVLISSYKMVIENILKRKRGEEVFEPNKKMKVNDNVEQDSNDESIEMEYPSIDIKYPTSWENNTKECGVIELDSESNEYKDIRNNFLQLLPKMDVEVTNIIRVQNKRLYAWYYLKKIEISQKPRNRGKDIEKFLYHGTNNEYINHIIKEGLDPRLAKLSGSIGVGVYFAESPKTSLAYVSSTSDIKRMFLCRVAVGHSEKGSKGLRRPPYVNDTIELADSVEGVIGKDKIWVVFDTYQSYPEYIIDFKINPNLLPKMVLPIPNLSTLPYHTFFPMSMSNTNININQIINHDSYHYLKKPKTGNDIYQKTITI